MPTRATPLHDVPEAILWEEGMLLAPPHFQQASRRQEEVTAYHAQLAAPFHWGVVELAWDQRDLPVNVLRVERLEAVMPDGLAVRSHPAQELAVDLSGVASNPSPQAVRVWLTLAPARRAEEPSAGREPRWCLGEIETVLDEHSDLDGEVRRIRPALKLEVGRLPDPRRVALPVAEVQRVNGTLRLADYVPPLLRAGPDSRPYAWCNQAATLVRNRATEMAQHAAQSEALAQQVRVLGAALPPFEAVARTGRVHPFTLYQALCAFAGAISAAVPGAPVLPRLFPTYDHDDLARSFEPLHTHIGKVMNKLVRARTTRHFEAREAGFRLPTLAAEWIEKGEILVGITARDGGGPGEAEAWLTASRIGSEHRVEALRDRRMLGAVRRPLSAADAHARGVTAAEREVLFVVTIDPDVVEPGKPLVIVNPTDLAGRTRPAAAVLYTA